MAHKHFDVLIVGAGISGAALAYELARYTNAKRIALVEKYGRIGSLNTHASSNSQTIHAGDIETNYTLSKAHITKRTAKMVERYALMHGYQNRIIFSHQKMALGVGEEEVEFMLERYEEFSELFPYLEVWDRQKLCALEPAVVYQSDGSVRPEPIVGVGAQGEWTTVDYGALAQSFVENAQKEPDVELELFLNAPVSRILERTEGGCEVEIPGATLGADFVVVDAGAHSLLLAHRMGVGLEYGCLPIAGSFYMAKRAILRGKVYMVQNPKLPFAALHGDPDLLQEGHTRFGPTALMLPRLERYTGEGMGEFWESLRFDSEVAGALWRLLGDGEIRSYIFKNLLYELPGVSKGLFLEEARKITPSLEASDIQFAKGFGGVRPQVISKKEKRLLLGEATIDPGGSILFNMTPSPGATSCLGNAERDMKRIAAYLGLAVDGGRFSEELVEKESCPLPEPIAEQKRFASAIREAIHRQEREMTSPEGAAPKHWEEEYSPWATTRYHWSL